MLKNVDMATKIILIILVVLVSYFLLFVLLQPFFVTTPRNMFEMMQQMMGINQTFYTLNIISIILAILIGLVISITIKTKPERELNEYKILKRALSEDEKKAINEIRKAEKITQDSLRFRLDWNKVKVSRILTNLDRMNLIQRERIGKTYNIYLQKRK